MVILALLIIVPIVEIYLLLSIGSAIGVLPTLGLIIGTAVLGTILLRQQGLKVLQRAQSDLNRGAVPAQALADGLCLFAAGALLLTPGFATDAFGFALLFPPTRKWIQQGVSRSAIVRTRYQQWPPQGAGPGASAGQSARRGGDGDAVIIDGEYRDESQTPNADKNRLDS